MVRRIGLLLALGAVLVAVAAVACTSEVIKEVEIEKPVIVVKEVIKEVPVEKIVTVEKEVIKEVPVEKIVTVTKEVVREVTAEGKVLENLINVRMSSMVPKYDPHTSRSGAVSLVNGLIFSSLVQADPVGQKWAPDLAERWSLSDDARTYTFHLRKNVSWHDGEPVTADDVAFTFKSYLTIESGSIHAAAFAMIKGAAEYQDGTAAEISGIQVVDDQTIIFEMENPSVVFIEALNASSGGLTPVPILPEHILGSIEHEKVARHPFFQEVMIGSGPFKFVKWVDDQFMEMVADDDFYFGRPKLDRIIMRVIPSPDAGQIAMQRGEIDVTMRGGYPKEALESFMRDPRFDVLAAKNTVIGAWFMNGRVEALKDPRIRQAMMRGIDRVTIGKTFSVGSEVFNSPLIHTWFQKPEWQGMYPYDPDKAKALLKDAGWDPNRVVEMMTGVTTSQERRDRLAIEQQMFLDFGMKVEYVEFKTPQWVENFYDTFTYEAAISGTGIFGDVDGLLNSFFHTKSKNPMGYASPEMDALIEKGATIVDREERKKYYQDLNEKYYLVDLPMVTTFNSASTWARNKKFYIPAFAKIGDPKSLGDLILVPVFVGRDDNWRYHPELWEVRR